LTHFVFITFDAFQEEVREKNIDYPLTLKILS